MKASNDCDNDNDDDNDKDKKTDIEMNIDTKTDNVNNMNDENVKNDNNVVIQISTSMVLTTHGPIKPTGTVQPQQPVNDYNINRGSVQSTDSPNAIQAKPPSFHQSKSQSFSQSKPPSVEELGSQNIKSDSIQILFRERSLDTTDKNCSGSVIEDDVQLSKPIKPEFAQINKNALSETTTSLKDKNSILKQYPTVAMVTKPKNKQESNNLSQRSTSSKEHTCKCGRRPSLVFRDVGNTAIESEYATDFDLKSKSAVNASVEILMSGRILESHGCCQCKCQKCSEFIQTKNCCNRHVGWKDSDNNNDNNQNCDDNNVNCNNDQDDNANNNDQSHDDKDHDKDHNDHNNADNKNNDTNDDKQDEKDKDEKAEYADIEIKDDDEDGEYAVLQNYEEPGKSEIV